MALGDEPPQPEEFLHPGGGAGVAHDRLAVEVVEDHHRRGAHAIGLEGEVLLGSVVALEIHHFHVTLDVDGEDAEVFAEVVLHLGLVQHRALHAVAEGAFVQLEENQDALLTLGAGDRQLFLQVAPGFIEEVRGRVAGPGGLSLRAGRQQGQQEKAGDKQAPRQHGLPAPLLAGPGAGLCGIVRRRCVVRRRCIVRRGAGGGLGGNEVGDQLGGHRAYLAGGDLARG